MVGSIGRVFLVAVGVTLIASAIFLRSPAYADGPCPSKCLVGHCGSDTPPGYPGLLDCGSAGGSCFGCAGSVTGLQVCRYQVNGGNNCNETGGKKQCGNMAKGECVSSPQGIYCNITNANYQKCYVWFCDNP